MVGGGGLVRARDRTDQRGAARRGEPREPCRRPATGFNKPVLDQASLLSCLRGDGACGGRHASAGTEAATWADRADQVARPSLEASVAMAKLARAHALRGATTPQRPHRQARAARLLAAAGLLLNAGQGQAVRRPGRRRSRRASDQARAQGLARRGRGLRRLRRALPARGQAVRGQHGSVSVSPRQAGMAGERGTARPVAAGA